jgi:hypothetical protein
MMVCIYARLRTVKELEREDTMKVTYICDICGKPQETLEIDDLTLEKLGINTLTLEEKEDIIKYNEEQGLLLYSLCPACFEESLAEGVLESFK